MNSYHINHGINFFDMCTTGALYIPFGRAIAGQREKVFLQVHFGAVYIPPPQNDAQNLLEFSKFRASCHFRVAPRLM